MAGFSTPASNLVAYAQIAVDTEAAESLIQRRDIVNVMEETSKTCGEASV